jgi:hypothetical protein
MTPGETEREREAEIIKASDDTQAQPAVLSLASHIRTRWQAALKAKLVHERQGLKNLRARQKVYEPDVLAKIQAQGDVPVYSGLTDNICRAAISWLNDIMIPPGEMPFHAEATPIPSMPKEIEARVKQVIIDTIKRLVEAGEADPALIDLQQVREAGTKIRDQFMDQLRQRAKEDAEKMRDEINDELTEGGWYKVIRDLIDDVVTFPAAFMEGPIYRKKKVLEYEIVRPGYSVPRVVDKTVKTYERIDFFDAYPSPGAKSVQDGYFIRKMRYARTDLTDMIGVEGYDEPSIRAVLIQYGNGHIEWSAIDTEKSTLMGRDSEDENVEGNIDGLKYWGSVQGRRLIEWGMSKDQITDPEKEYQVTAVLIGNYVIMARLNPHPLNARGLYSASFVEQVGSIMGRAVPQLVDDEQDACNSSWRAIIRNMGIASGPMAWFFADRIPAGEKMTEMFPWKLFAFNSADTDGKPPMGFFMPESRAVELMGVFEKFEDKGHDKAGIPKYIIGTEQGKGAARTASGLAMLRSDAAKGLKLVAGNLDTGIIAPSVTQHHTLIMVYEPDRARGDVRIKARASDYLVQVEQLQMRRQEFKQTLGPVDMEILGRDGMAEFLREMLKSLKMPPDMIPDQDSIRFQMQRAKVIEAVQAIAMALNLPFENLMQIASAPPQQKQLPAPGQPAPEETDVAGNPMAGKGARLFNQGG